MWSAFLNKWQPHLPTRIQNPRWGLAMADNMTSEQRRVTMSRIRGCDTKIELSVRKELHKRGYRLRVTQRGSRVSQTSSLPKFDSPYSSMAISGTDGSSNNGRTSSPLIGVKKSLRTERATSDTWHVRPQSADMCFPVTLVEQGRKLVVDKTRFTNRLCNTLTAATAE
ncbi:hypothetical protein BWP39_09720 [Paraburkholderia acidicola]|uniref:Uncharacterized protein n=1 Tax=Paraburkholderia acidicola TaxID=1912599 RepID=A0A2A4F1T3_9BURK|nr:hypothetical protein BWP39_09720 [Paraburkholderia acidicola]